MKSMLVPDRYVLFINLLISTNFIRLHSLPKYQETNTNVINIAYILTTTHFSIYIFALSFAFAEDKRNHY